jgi:uncharacterized protein (DUF1697 family)
LTAILHVALLRGINVGGHNKIAMSELRDLFSDLGFAGVQSLLQSGNVVFESPRLTGAELEGVLEKETAQRLGVSVDYVVRTSKEWQSIVAANPFPRKARDDPSHLVVMCLKSAVVAKHVDALRGAIQGRETVRGDGKQLYIVYPDGIGTSKFTAALIERTLGIRGTARNWNTVLKLANLCE